MPGAKREIRKSPFLSVVTLSISLSPRRTTTVTPAGVPVSTRTLPLIFPVVFPLGRSWADDSPAAKNRVANDKNVFLNLTTQPPRNTIEPPEGLPDWLPRQTY